MRFTCEKAKLSSAIAVAIRTVAPKSAIPALEGIHVRAGEDLQLTGFNLETGVTVRVEAEIEEPGVCVMPARLFFDIVRKLPDEDVSFSMDEGRKVNIRSGISSFSIMAIDAEEYPELPDVEFTNGIRIPQKELRELNPTAQIITIGVFNPVHAINIIGGDVITFGKIADNVLLPMNSYIARVSAQYGCTYVDVVDVQTDSSVHPTDAGYDDMTARILAKVRPITAFNDISWLDPEFQKAIQWAVNTRITNGTGEGTFSPLNVCTRAEILTYLWRLAGEPKAETAASFIDVKADDYFAEAVAWAAEKGITEGTTAFTFSPYALCTRAQIVTFLYRYEQATNPDFEEASSFSGFRDIGLGAYYGAPVAWAVKAGIAKGVSTTLFGPLQPCTRAQAVTFLARYVGA